jgi:transaldolase
MEGWARDTHASSVFKTKLNTKILVDGGDPDETLRVKKLLGFVDGQTTNPSLIAKNPEVLQLVSSGHRLTEKEENEEYRKIIQQISPLVGDAGISIEALPTWTPLLTKCLTKARRCSRGPLMRTSNTHAPLRD